MALAEAAWVDGFIVPRDLAIFLGWAGANSGRKSSSFVAAFPGPRILFARGLPDDSALEGAAAATDPPRRLLRLPGAIPGSGVLGKPAGERVHKSPTRPPWRVEHKFYPSWIS